MTILMIWFIALGNIDPRWIKTKLKARTNTGTATSRTWRLCGRRNPWLWLLFLCPPPWALSIWKLRKSK